MNTLVHDLDENDFLNLKIDQNKYRVINANVCSAPCTGCFSCWFKTPGICRIQDSLQNISCITGRSEDTVIISRNCYGGYSEQVKKILDRSVPASLPFFTYRSWKIRHTKRYKTKRKNLTVILYGDFSESEKKVAELIVEANRSNMGFKKAIVYTVNEIYKIGRLLNENYDL